jgi:hypothetical protein
LWQGYGGSVEPSRNLASGEVGEGFVDPPFAHPTIARYDDRLLVVNSQFDRRESVFPEPTVNPSRHPLVPLLAYIDGVPREHSQRSNCFEESGD